MSLSLLPQAMQHSESWLVANADKIPVKPSSSQRICGDKIPHLLPFHDVHSLIKNNLHTFPIYYHHAGEPFTSVDIDSAIDPGTGTVHPWCQALFNALGEHLGYLEYSSSGTGFRLPCAGKLEKNKLVYYASDQRGKNSPKFELLGNEHLATYTGQIAQEIESTQATTLTPLDQVMAFLRQQYPEQHPPAQSSAPPGSGFWQDPPDTDAATIQEALSYLSPDCGHDDWKNIGMALHDWDAGEKGFCLWLEWSRPGQSFKSEAQLKIFWKSFRSGKGLTIGTLFKAAQDAGFQFPKPASPKKNSSPKKKTVKKKSEAQVNSLMLVDQYCQQQRQQPGWHYVLNDNGSRLPYSDHEDHLILWAQQHNVPKCLTESRPVAAAYRVLQQRQYLQLVSDIATDLSQPATDKNSDFFALAERLQLNESEQMVLYWWLSDRKKVLLQLARGETPQGAQVPMPVLFSAKQNTGKSYFVETLCQPLGDLVDVKNVSDLEDNFGHSQWSRLLIANFDELVGLDKMDIKRFKQWIYVKRYSKRKMHSELINIIDRITAGIGSSNEPIAEMISDTTGTRRLFDIQAPSDGRLIELSKSFDFLSLWRSLPTDILPSQEERQQILQVQEQQRPQDPVESWYEEQGRLVIQSQAGSHSGKGILATDLYKEFQLWCYENGEKMQSNTRFGRRLMTFFGHELERTKSGNKYYKWIT